MMMEAFLAVWMVGLVALRGAHGYDTGAPADVCVSMAPDHGTNTLTGTAYSISSSSSSFSTSSKVQVTIKGTFKGFLLQARIPNTTTIVGTWDTPPAGNQFLQCSGTSNNALTHSYSTAKTDLTLTWIPPSTNPPSSVVFMATVVRLKRQWQEAVLSSPLSASSGYTTTTKAPAKPTSKAPAKTTSKAPAKPTSKAPAKTTSKAPAKPTTKGGNSAERTVRAVSGSLLGALLMVGRALG